MIKVEHLYRSFNETQVLEDINLEIKKGERLCIVGSTGCGKSVLVRHFNRLQRPDKGKVIVYDKDLEEVSDDELDEIRKKIGYVFQEGALFNSLNVYDNIAFPLRESYGFSEDEIESRTRECIEAVGLGGEYDKLIKKMPRELSGGMRKRVAVARTLAPNPPIIIYDEPTTGLDPRFVGIISGLMVKLHEEYDNTSIVVTHDLKTMRKVGHRMIMLDNARIYFDGDYNEFMNSTDPVILKYLDKERRDKTEGITNSVQTRPVLS